MLPDKPYIARAYYEWILDSGATPYVMVETQSGAAIVPFDYIEDDQIVLNVSPDAVSDLNFGDRTLTFVAHFSGRPFHVVVPIGCLVSIYAAENGEGCDFPNTEHLYPDEVQNNAGSAGGESSGGGAAKGSHLKVVK